LIYSAAQLQECLINLLTYLLTYLPHRPVYQCHVKLHHNLTSSFRVIGCFLIRKKYETISHVSALEVLDDYCAI